MSAEQPSPSSVINLPSTENKAVYTAALVADGWAGAENLENSFVTDGRTDGRTDGPTDRRTDGPKSGL